MVGGSVCVSVRTERQILAQKMMVGTDSGGQAATDHSMTAVTGVGNSSARPTVHKRSCER